MSGKRAYLTKRRELGTLGPVPWQIYLSDAYLVIPSALLHSRKSIRRSGTSTRLVSTPVPV